MKLILLALSFAFGGSFVGNPLERHSPNWGRPWFSSGTVRWCSAQASTLAPRMVQAAALWSEYMQLKQIPGVLLFELVNCDGREDLRIERNADPQSSSLSYSLQEKKVIWLSPELDGDALTTQLSHQLGHVLGNEHIPGTIMVESVPQSPAPMLRIDGSRELYLCRTCAFTARGPQNVYVEKNGQAEVQGPNGFSISFISDVGEPELNESRVFGEWHSRGLSRLALIHGQPAIVQRNFANLVEIRDLSSGKLLFESP